MQEFPHQYSVAAAAGVDGDVTLEGERLPGLRSAPPLQFGGPGDRWSPETLLVAAVADCFVLTFRTIAQMPKLRWMSLTCDVAGTVDRVERVTQFIGFVVRARLRIPDWTNQEQAQRLLAKAEQTCLVSNSLKARSHLEAIVEVVSSST